MKKSECKLWCNCCDYEKPGCTYENLPNEFCQSDCERFGSCEWCVNCGDDGCLLSDDEIEQIGR